MFPKNTEKIYQKVLKIVEKNDYDKLDKYLNKNKNNIELFEKLLNDEDFMDKVSSPYSGFLIDDLGVFPKLDLEIQKKMIRKRPYLFVAAKEEIRNNFEFVMEVFNNKIDDLKEDAVQEIIRKLGKNITSNKEFITLLFEKFPDINALNLDFSEFSPEELKDFFGSHLNYLSDAPDFIKNDYEFISLCILIMAKEDVISEFRWCDKEYLEKEEIKMALIKKIGEREYMKMIVWSISFNEDMIKNIAPEELKKYILIDPSCFDGNDYGSIFSLNINQRKNIMLLDAIDKMRDKTEKINSPQSLINLLIKLNNLIGEDVSKITIEENVKKYWNDLESMFKPADNYMNDQFKLIFNILMGIKGNKMDSFLQVFINNDLLQSEYVDNYSKIDINDNNKDFLRLICKTSLFNLDNNKLEVLNRLFLKACKTIKNPYAVVECLSYLVNDNKLFNLILNENIESLDNEIIFNLYNYVKSDINQIITINNINDLRDLDKLIDEGIDRQPLLNTTIVGKKYALLMKHFSIGEDTAKELIHSYFESDRFNSFYQKNEDAYYLKTLLEKVLNTNDLNELNKIGIELEDNNINISYIEIQNIVNNIKKKYQDDLNSCLVQLEKGTQIYDYSDKKFNLLVHVIGAYGSKPVGDTYDSWNTKDNTDRISICTSLICNDNLGTARPGESAVILGFNNLPEDSLQLMCNEDLASRGYLGYLSSKFQSPEELKNNTRFGHNEIVISRRIGDYTENKLQPSYIICFDSINNESRLAATKFNIPIIFIDREKVAIKNQSKIIQMVEIFKTTLDYNLIPKIICEQENNKAGFRLSRPDLSEKYFDKTFRQTNIDTIYNIIKQGLNNNDSRAINAMNTFVKTLELESEKFKTVVEYKERDNPFDINYTNYIDEFKSNNNYSEDIKEENLSIEDAYKKFIHIRNQVSLSEQKELEELNKERKII